MEPQPTKSIVLPIILSILVSAILFGGLGYYLANTKNATQVTSTTLADTTQTSIPTASATVTTSTDEALNWKTYTNTKYSYSIKYPTNWAYTESPDTKSGAGFRLATKSDNPENDFLTVYYSARPTNLSTMSFEDYVKIAAIQEIEGYKKLTKIQKVTTNSGIVGYTTYWQYTDHTGATLDSRPITYFPPSDGKLTGTIQISSNASELPSNPNEDHDKMVKTFSYTK